MKIQQITGVSLLTALLIATASIAQERKIKRSDLPAAVETTVAAQSAGATIKGFSEEKEDGKTFYEVKTVINGHSKDILIDATGVVVEVEEEVAIGDLSTEVKAGLRVGAGNAKITKVESLTKKGQLVAYEAHTLKDGKKSEVQVSPDGKLLAHEE
jgi:transcription elongation factor